MRRRRERPSSARGSIAGGVWITLLLHVGIQGVLFFGLFWFLPKGEPSPLIFPGGGPRVLAFVPGFYIGVSQLVYVFPALIVALRRDRPATAMGIVIAAAATGVLNAAWLVAFWVGGF